MNLETLAVALVASVDKFKDGLSEADSVAKGWAGNLGGAVGGLLTGGLIAGAAAATGAVVAVGAAAFDVSRQVDNAAADMAASLGVPADEAERFAEVAKRVYGNNFADDVMDAANGVKEVAKQMRLAADDPSLKKMTENAFRLRDSFGVDVTESVSAAKTLMDNFGISGEDAFNLIARGYQSGLDRSGDFLDTIGEYSVQFADGGASVQEFFSTLDTGLQGGMLGTDKAADLFKEFRLRIQDGSDSTKDALQAIGLNADDMAVKFADGSLTAIDAFNMVGSALRATDDQNAQFTAGVALMGSQFEDLGQTAALAIDPMANSFSNLEGSVDSLDAKYATFGSAVEGVWRRLVVSVSPFTDKLLDMVNDAMPSVMAAFDAFDATVGPAMENAGRVIDSVVRFANDLFGQFKGSINTDAIGPLKYWQDWIDQNMPRIQRVINAVLGAVQAFWGEFGDDILHITNNVFGTIYTVIDAAMRNIGDMVTLVLQVLTGDFEGAGQTLNGIVQRTWETLRTIIQNSLDNIRTVIMAVDWGGMGRSIIDGIANGIRNGARFIIEAAENAARSAFDAARNWLGINSPSKVASEQIGEPFAQGIGVGVQRGMGDLIGRIDTGLTSMMSSIIEPSAPMTDGQASGNTFTFNVYANDRLQAKLGILDGLRQAGLA